MEIKDPIHGSIEVSNSEVAVIDSQEFQRLRAIKQLGFAEFSFPGATHNRFLHSVGVMHLSSIAFDQIFKSYKFSSEANRLRLRQTVRLSALLHDIGHGPLSHTTEEVMPKLGQLKISAYQHRDQKLRPLDLNRRATHEDYTVLFLTDSNLTTLLRENFSDIDPLAIASLIDLTLKVKDDFFVDHGLNLRPVLSQIVSSEMDVDRMDYLERDAYFCGTNYGRVELEWLLNNLTSHEVGGNVYMALNRRAIYTFDDFLISRHHMYLMIYFHHKSIVYEEMLHRYLVSPDCRYHLPAEIDEYIGCNDASLYVHLKGVENRWAQRIALQRPFRMLIELHATEPTRRPELMREMLEAEGIEVIHASSHARLSKYHATQAQSSHSLFVVDQYDPMEKPVPIEQCTEIFQKYEGTRMIERLYVASENFQLARKLIIDRKL